MKRRILCFGDSNTHGYTPTGGRFDEAVRWPMRMGRLLDETYGVIEEGFNGRTTVHDDPTEGGYKSGAMYLPPCLMSSNPLDLVILMLGTNDTKQRFQMNAHTISQGVGELIRLVHQYGADADGQPPRVLVVSPPLIGDNIMDTIMGPIFGPQSATTSRGFAEAYRKLALLWKAEYLNAAEFVQPSALDAVHLTEESHLALAQAMADKVQSIFRKA